MKKQRMNKRRKKLPRQTLVTFEINYDNQWELKSMPRKEFNLLHSLSSLETMSLRWFSDGLIEEKEYYIMCGMTFPYHTALNKLQVCKHVKRANHRFKQGLKKFGTMPNSFTQSAIVERWSQGISLTEIELRIFASAFFHEDDYKNVALVKLKNLRIAVANFSFN